MPNEEWGVKRACPKCAVRFFDLQNDPMTCPSCGSEFTADSLMDSGKSRVAAARASKAKAPVVDEADVVLDDSDEDEVKATGDDLLDDDDEEDTANLEEVADVAKEDDDS
ncbi:MAG: TIGR02300 family protein [Rhodobacteraceae bacterium]|nr:TIGR02300 family protein [Paracoccaceae bacterium]